MKRLVCGLTISFSFLAGTAVAELTLKVDGEDYQLSSLMENYCWKNNSVRTMKVRRRCLKR